MIDYNDHFTRYLHLMDLAAASFPSRRRDAGYMAAFYILSADKDLYALVQPQVNSDGVDFCKLMKDLRHRELSNSQVIAAKAAFSLFNDGVRSVTPHDLAQCDYNTLDIIVNGLYIWKCGRIPTSDKDGKMQLDTAVEQQSRQIEQSLFCLIQSES
jgi:hypothetical protein